MKYIFLNWKAGVNYGQALVLAHLLKQIPSVKDRQIVVLPPAVFLLPVVEILKDSVVSVGLQDISAFESGPYTGEVTAAMVSTYAHYCLLGHSERRRNFNESNETVNKKMELCYKYDITPVICVSQKDQLKAIRILAELEKIFILYESPSFIGGEETLGLSEILKFAQELRSSPGLTTAKFIYGGSVNETNIATILNQPEIDGVGVGHASLDPERIRKMLFS